MPDAKISTVQMDDGAKLHVKLHGEDSTKKKPLLIGLHGAPGLVTHTALDEPLSHLATSFRVLVFDGRGSGVSDQVGPYTHERWMKDIENLRTWAGAETFVLAGHSYGGFLALDYAVNYGARLSGLILIDTWAVGTLGQMVALANALTSDRIKVDKARQLRVWSGNLLSDQDYQDGITELLPLYTPPEHAALKPAATTVAETSTTTPDLFGPNGPFHIHHETQNVAFSYNVPRFDVRNQLKDIKASIPQCFTSMCRRPSNNVQAPTLITVGRYDEVTPLFFAQELERGIPDSRLEIFEHTGHSPQLDEPDKFREVLQDFLKTKVL